MKFITAKEGYMLTNNRGAYTREIYTVDDGNYWTEIPEEEAFEKINTISPEEFEAIIKEAL